ncbi:aminoglycoside phosphotransferase family protein [Bacillus sp. JJ1521]|uniref:phosphotransferase family protein n=1 Tax=Bacillus sp. JJ1521 TaxID=3122957 RepID=UPI0030009062
MNPIQLTEIPDKIKEFVKHINSIRFPQQGCTSDVGILETEKGRYALKRAKNPLYRSWLKRETFVVSQLTTNTTLSIPKVVSSFENEEQTWALFEFVEGETLATALSNEKNEQKRHELIYNYGKILSQIHSTSCPNKLVSEVPWLEKMLMDAEVNLKNHEVDGTEELLTQLKTNKPKEFKQTLIHGDFTIDNVMVKDGLITGVIDWGGSALGDPRYDVSLAIRPETFVFNNETDKQVFFDGYREQIIDQNEYYYFADGLYEFF